LSDGRNGARNGNHLERRTPGKGRKPYFRNIAIENDFAQRGTALEDARIHDRHPGADENSGKGRAVAERLLPQKCHTVGNGIDIQFIAVIKSIVADRSQRCLVEVGFRQFNAAVKSGGADGFDFIQADFCHGAAPAERVFADGFDAGAEADRADGAFALKSRVADGSHRITAEGIRNGDVDSRSRVAGDGCLRIGNRIDKIPRNIRPCRQDADARQRHQQGRCQEYATDSFHHPNLLCGFRRKPGASMFAFLPMPVPAAPSPGRWPAKSFRSRRRCPRRLCRYCRRR